LSLKIRKGGGEQSGKEEEKGKRQTRKFNEKKKRTGYLEA